MGVGIIFTRPQYWNPLKLYWPQSLDRILRTLIRRAGSAARGPRGSPKAGGHLRTWRVDVAIRVCVFFFLLPGVMGETQGYPSSHRGRRDVYVGPEIRRVAFSSHGGLDATSEIPPTTGFWHIRVSSVHDAAHRSFHAPLRGRLVLFPVLPCLSLFFSFFTARRDATRHGAARGTTDFAATRKFTLYLFAAGSLMCTARASRYTRGICRATDPLIYCMT